MRRVILACLVLGLSACGIRERDEMRAQYDATMAEIDEPIVVTASSLNGIWERAGEFVLYRDPNDERYNSRTEKWFPESADLLLIYDGKIATEKLRMGCPFPYDEPTWLIETGLDVEDVSRSPARDIPSYLQALVEKKPDAWAAFTIEGQTLLTDKIIRGGLQRKDRPQAPEEPFNAIKLVKAPEGELRIAYFKPNEKGVHTILELYKKLDGATLSERLKKSHAVPPCK